MVDVDPFFVFLLLFFVGLAFFLFLLVRRTFAGFKEGMKRGRQ